MLRHLLVLLISMVSTVGWAQVIVDKAIEFNAADPNQRQVLGLPPGGKAAGRRGGFRGAAAAAAVGEHEEKQEEHPTSHRSPPMARPALSLSAGCPRRVGNHFSSST